MIILRRSCWIIVFGFIVFPGCAQKNTPTLLTLPSNHRPLFSVNWPSAPSELTELIVCDGQPRKNYKATLKLNMGDNYLLFVASDIEDVPEGGETQNPLSCLDRLKQLESFGEEIEITDHLFDGFPGYFVTKKFNRLNRYSRGITTIVNGHVIGISVNAATRELLNSPEINAFFESFRVTPEPFLDSSK